MLATSLTPVHHNSLELKPLFNACKNDFLGEEEFSSMKSRCLVAWLKCGVRFHLLRDVDNKIIFSFLLRTKVISG